MNSFRNGSGQLSDLAWEFAWGILRPVKVSSKNLKLVIDTLRVIPWAKEIIGHVGGKKVNDLLQRLRRTPISQMEYSAMVQMLTDPIGVDSLEHGTWTLWGEWAHKYNLHKTMERVGMRATIRTLTQWGN